MYPEFGVIIVDKFSSVFNSTLFRKIAFICSLVSVDWWITFWKFVLQVKVKTCSLSSKISFEITSAK